MKQNIELHIEELVLHGFAGYDKHQIGEAVEREITRLLQEQGLPTNLSYDVKVGNLNAGSFTFQQNAKPEVVGNNIANSVYKGLEK